MQSTSCDRETELFGVLSAFLARLSCQGHSAGTEALADADLTLTQLRALLVLGHHGGPVPIGDLARALGVSAATAGRTVDRLVRDGFVERRENLEDRRIKHILLTVRGLAIADQHRDNRQRALEAFVDRLPVDQAETLVDAIRPILAGDALRPTPKDPS